MSYKKNTEGGTTGTIGWTGVRSRKLGETAFMMRLGVVLGATPGTRRCGSSNRRGQPGAGVDPDPIALADGNLEFRWSCHATDVGNA